MHSVHFLPALALSVPHLVAAAGSSDAIASIAPSSNSANLQPLEIRSVLQPRRIFRPITNLDNEPDTFNPGVPSNGGNYGDPIDLTPDTTDHSWDWIHYGDPIDLTPDVEPKPVATANPGTGLDPTTIRPSETSAASPASTKQAEVDGGPDAGSSSSTITSSSDAADATEVPIVPVVGGCVGDLSCSTAPITTSFVSNSTTTSSRPTSSTSAISRLNDATRGRSLSAACAVALPAILVGMFIWA